MHTLHMPPIIIIVNQRENLKSTDHRLIGTEVVFDVEDGAEPEDEVGQEEDEVGQQHATHSSYQCGGCCRKLVRYEERLENILHSPSGLTKVKNTWILNSFHHPSELCNRFIARGGERSIVMLRHSWGAVKRPSGSS